MKSSILSLVATMLLATSVLASPVPVETEAEMGDILPSPANSTLALLTRATSSSSGTATNSNNNEERAVPIYKTAVRVYVLGTGDDSGSQAELRGLIRMSDGDHGMASDFPVKTIYDTENGGKGRLLGWWTVSRAFSPSGLEVQLFEDDNFGKDWILNYKVDFAVPGNLGYADGREWSVIGTNKGDTRYKARLEWQVTPPV